MCMYATSWCWQATFCASFLIIYSISTCECMQLTFCSYLHNNVNIIHSDLFLFICRPRDSDCKRFKVIHHKCFAILKQTIGLEELILDKRHLISLFQLYMLSLAAYGMTNPDLQKPTALESSLASTIDNILSVLEYKFLVRFFFSVLSLGFQIRRQFKSAFYILLFISNRILMKHYQY